ncbi:MAG: hypothetical protein K2J80_04915, partial [Oscillospiraceae bacterium]|nr:hypothetical protein [Oscillospiraceae bacterium]
MSIERSIYASLPLGIEQDKQGFQFYSYTPNFRQLLEKDTTGTINGIAAAGYTEPDGKEWLSDLPENVDGSTVNEDDYTLSIPQTTADANRAELKARRFHPYAMSYKTVNVDGTDKGVFWFGKNLGIDWSGGRPGNKYIYTAVCDMADIKKAPIFYCSSSAVCCNILRSEFYPEGGQTAKPGLLKQIGSLDEEEELAPLEYSAGFDKITVGEIVDFLKTDDNLEIFCSMISALMDCKDGNLRSRMIIADERRSTLLWIAALSYVFPVENVRRLSYSSYTFSPSDFDINGVYVPTLNGGFKSSRAGYDFNTARGSYAVYDFSTGIFAPEVAVKDGIFMSMLENAFGISISLLDNYKDYIACHTDYRGLDSDYAKGYSLFAYMTNVMKYDLGEAVDFAKKHLSPAQKKEVLMKMLGDYEKLAEKPELLLSVNDFKEHCCSNGVESRENINKFFVQRFGETFFDASANDDEVRAKEDTCCKICGISDDDLCEMFAETNSIAALSEIVSSSKSLYRIMFINRAVLLCADKKGNKITHDSDTGKIVTTIIGRMIVQDTPEKVTNIENFIREDFAILRSAASRVGLCDSMLCALTAARLHNCAAAAIAGVSELFMSGDPAARGEVLAAVETAAFSEDLIMGIFERIKSEPNTANQLESLMSFCKCGERFTKKYAEDIKDIVKSSLNGMNAASPDAELNVYYSAFNLLKLVAGYCDRRDIVTEYERVCQGYIQALIRLYPDYIADNGCVQKLDEIRTTVNSAGGDGENEVFCVFYSLAVMRDNVGAPKNKACFTQKSAITFPLVDVTILPSQFSDVYLTSIGTMCGKFWAKSDVMPLFTQLVYVDSDRADKAHQTIFTAMFKTALKEMKSKGRTAADVIEYS